MNKYYGIIISTIAGFSTLLGFFMIYIKGNKNMIISKSLSFAAGVMITLSVIDLLPSSINNLNDSFSFIISIFLSLIFFIFGFIISKKISKKINNKNELYSSGIISMLGIIIHNIPEGIATYVLSTIDIKLGVLLSIAIILHNIPEGIGIAIPIYYSTNNKLKAFLYTFVSGISEPFGALLSMVFLYEYINNIIIGILFSFIAGLMIYIGYFELLKISKKYDLNNKFYYFGCIFIIIIELLLKM